MTSEVAEKALDQKRMMPDGDEAPDAVPVPHALVPHLDEIAILLDIDGTLLELMPTPREVWVPPGLSETLQRLVERTSGALALVSGRPIRDLDKLFEPLQLPAVGGHGAETRLRPGEAPERIPDLDVNLRRRLIVAVEGNPALEYEDKGYSVASGSRGFIFNADPKLIVDFFDIGTRPRLTADR